MPVAVNAESARFADQIERSFRGGAWHGPAIVEVLDGVDAATASTRPLAASHCIAESVFHVAYWLDVSRRRIAGQAMSPLVPGADWPDAAELSETDWNQRLSDLEEAQRRLHATVIALTDERLEDPVGGSDPTVRGLLFGVLQHNAYHAGQIALMKKLGAGSPR